MKYPKLVAGKTDDGVLVVGYEGQEAHFMCVPTEGALAAYLLNCAEGAIADKPSDALEILQIIGDYLDGRCSISDAVGRIFSDT